MEGRGEVMGGVWSNDERGDGWRGGRVKWR